MLKCFLGEIALYLCLMSQNVLIICSNKIVNAILLRGKFHTCRVQCRDQLQLEVIHSVARLSVKSGATRDHPEEKGQRHITSDLTILRKSIELILEKDEGGPH